VSKRENETMDGKTRMKGCYNCMKRRIRCDLATPTCQKCTKKGLVCPGYGVRYRFSKINDGIEDLVNLEKIALPVPVHLEWIECQPSKETSLDDESEIELDYFEEDIQIIDRHSDFGLSSASGVANPLDVYALEFLDPKTRFLFAHCKSWTQLLVCIH
jgi:hypothetical protein